MFRTQLYIEKETNTEIDLLAKKTGTSKSDLLRKAIEEFLRKHRTQDALREVFGMWKDYDFDLRELRDEWDR